MALLLRWVVLLLLSLRSPAAMSPPEKWHYGTTNETNPDKLNVHIVMHSHEDPGWLMSVDQYYYSQVRYVLNSVTDALRDDPQRKFNYVEMAFFSRWWEEQGDARRALVRHLVKNKQLEFLNGGWCMHDEASPLYTEMVDQTTRGHQFILNEFGAGAAPKATWQIDPFGHSNTQAWLLSAQAGMPSMFWGRMDRDDRDARRKTKELEYIWRGSKSIGGGADTFGGAIWGGDGDGLYNCPVDFEGYKTIGVQDNPRRHDYNVEEWISKVLSAARKQASEYQSNHILWACGWDFSHKNADTWYHNMDLLMHYVNLDGRIHLLYSSPARYTEEKHRDPHVTWSLREDDIMPLHEYPHVYWTGYFSSRVAFKRLVRYAGNVLNTARQMAFFSHLGSTGSFSKIDSSVSQHTSGPSVGTSWTDELEAAISVATHHDGVSGTAKQAVNGDYAQRISEGQATAEQGMAEAVDALLGIQQNQGWAYCRDLNISLCSVTTTSEAGFSVVAWNPRGQTFSDYTFRIPVTAGSYEVWHEGELLLEPSEVQLVKLDLRTLELPLLYLNSFGLDEAQRLTKLSELRNKATHVLLFQADLPPVGMTLLTVKKNNMASRLERPPPLRNSFDNGVYRISLHPHTHAVRGIENVESGLSCEFAIDWGWYESSPGGMSEFGFGNTDLGAVSGAYIFRPNSSKFHRMPVLHTEIETGPVTTEIRQTMRWVSHVIRLNRYAPSVEVEYTVGPIPQTGNVGKEVVVRYSTCLTGSNGVFWVDSNGLEMVKRVRDQRPRSHPQTYSWRDEPIAGNYYPVNSLISIRDPQGSSFSVVTDSTQGGSSLVDGQVELMPHRRVFHDDHKGVEEPLNETMCGCNGRGEETCHCAGLTVRGVHQLVWGTEDARRVSAMQQMRPSLMFSKTVDVQPERWSFSGLQAALPPNVHLMTLSSNYAVKREGRVLLRLQHLYGVRDHSTLSAPVTVCLRNLFASISLASVQETTLTGNLPIEQKLSYSWRLREQQQEETPPKQVPYDPVSTCLTLHPMEIRTFWIMVHATQPLMSNE